MLRFSRTLVIAGLAVATLAGCGSSSSSSSTNTTGTDAGKLRVVTTTTQLTDFAANIGGNLIDLHPLLKANVDPHDFEPSVADLQALGDADVIVENGVHLEAWFDSTLQAADGDAVIVDASTGVDVVDDDPHIWQDPTNAKTMAGNIADALAKADPANAAAYEANLATYNAQLDDLDVEIRSQIDTLTNKKLVTNHDAFAYYVRRYGLEYVGSVIPSFDTQAELSPADVQDLVAKIRAQGVKAVFTEAALPSKTAEAIATEAGVAVVEGDDGLHGDSLGPAGGDADTYLKMMRHNTRTIVDNLR